MTVPRPDVLIVEADRHAREALRRALAHFGLRVEVAADGPEGVAKGLGLRPVAALVDLALPAPGACGVARALRRSLGGVLLVAHAACDPARLGHAAAEADFDRLLTKPCDLAELAGLLSGDRPVGAGGAAWRSTAVSRLRDAEDLLDSLEASGFRERELVVAGSSLVVRWR